MAVNDFSIVLSAYRPGGDPIDPGDFVAAIGVPPAPYDVYGCAAQWHAVGLRIGHLSLSAFEHLAEPDDAYKKAIEECLIGFADWLSHVPEANIAALRKRGVEVWVVVNLEIDADQMDFHLPFQLSSQMGRLKLRLYVLSNE